MTVSPVVIVPEYCTYQSNWSFIVTAGLMLLALFLLRVRRGIDKTKIQLGANKNPLPKKNENPTTIDR